MEDIELARSLLEEENLNLIIVKEDASFSVLRRAE